MIRHRLETEHTVERVDEREIDTEHGAFRLHTYRDRLSHTLHFALLRGEPDPATPTLVRVHVHNRLADGLHWRRADFGPLVGEVLAAIDLPDDELEQLVELLRRLRAEIGRAHV